MSEAIAETPETPETTKKIEELTPEQEAKLDVYRDKWIAIGHATGKCDIEATRPFVDMAYKAAELPPPSEIIRVASPMACQEKLVELGLKPMDAFSAQAYGNHDANWLGFYEFFWKECGINEIAQLEGLIGIANNCGWWAPLADLCILQDRPDEIHFNGRHELHNEEGMALRYSDGFGLWMINGVTVTEQIVMKPETLAIPQINGETNVEVKRVMIERFGVESYLEAVGAKLLDKDIEPSKPGAAPRCLIEDDQGGKWLYGTDGSSGRTYYIPVEASVQTCKAAHESICGFDESDIVAKS